MQQQNFTLPYPPLQVRAGVLVADGYGIRINCLYGKLRVEDGIGPHRRSIVLDRTGSDAACGRLERLVLLGKSFSITGEVIAWLRAIGAAFVVISPDANIIAESVPIGYAGEPIRRAQALASANGLGVMIARELIGYKLDGERKNLARLRADVQAFDRLRDEVDRAATIDAVRLCEAKAAAIYWNAWKDVSIRFRGRDLARIPSRWTRFDSRASALTGAPRAATNAVCALVNFCHAIAESEARLAILAYGMDVMLGVMHSDQRGRASFVYDCLEPVYPDVESFVLDVLQEKTFTARDFIELPNGVTRVRAPLTHELALSSVRWRQALAPIVARVAQVFRSAQTGRVDVNGSTPPTRPSRNARRPLADGFHTGREAAAIPRSDEGIRARKASQIPHRSSAQSPLSATPRKATVPRPYATKAWTAPRPEALALIPAACARCGKPVVKRRRRHCQACMPETRREHGLRAIERAREALRLQTLAGEDPRADAETNRKRGEAIAEQRRRNRQWKRAHPEGVKHDRAWFLREVMPKLDDVPLRAIASVTGLSAASCTRYRTGTRVPHPRHWEVLLTLIKRLDV